MTSLVCKFPTCGRDDIRARGWCKKHYERWRRHGDPAVCHTSATVRACTVEGCSKRRYSGGLCSGHADRRDVFGEVYAGVRLGDHESLMLARRGRSPCEECGGPADCGGEARWCRVCMYVVTNLQRVGKRAAGGRVTA